MSRILGSLTPRFILLSFLVVLAFASPALADLITWTLTGVTLDDGGSATGSFVYNTESGTITNWNITAQYGTASLPGQNGFLETVTNPFNFTSANSGAVIDFTVGGVFFETPDLTPAPYYALYFHLDPATMLGTPGTVPIISASGVYPPGINSVYAIATYGSGYPGTPGSYLVFFDDITGGSLVGTPLPPSALLLGSGLLGLGALGWRRKNS
jgi:hypothetical protein